jgi:exopolysaccharide biosynthesis WecB/TagA/CpsF family protein
VVLSRVRVPFARQPRSDAAVLTLDDYDVEEFAALAAGFGTHAFGYVVTPNVDQLIRYEEDAQFRKLYAGAAYVLLDSRFLAHWLALLRRQQLRVCPGSDLTARLLQHSAGSADRLVLVGGTASQARQLAAQFDLRSLTHIEPPMGFIRDAAQVEQCLQRIEAASPFRYCLLALGSPQQELLAGQLQRRAQARGLALCVGASINFLTGTERRAPPWMRRLGAEWLFRLLQSPGRLGHRYLVRGPRIFALLPHLRFVPRRRAPARVN